MRDKWQPRPFSDYKMTIENERAESAEQEIRTILKALKSNCTDDFVVIQDGAIDWSRTIDEFVSFIRLNTKGDYHARS